MLVLLLVILSSHWAHHKHEVCSLWVQPVSVPPSIWCEFYLEVWPVQCGLFLCLPLSGVSFTWKCGLFSVACFCASLYLVWVLLGSVACSVWPVSVPPSIWCEFYLEVWPVQCGLFLCLPLSGVSFTWKCGLFSVACFCASLYLVWVLLGSVACSVWPVSVPPSIWCEFYLEVWPVQCGLFLCLPLSGVSFTWKCGLFSVACFCASLYLVWVLLGSVACSVWPVSVPPSIWCEFYLGVWPVQCGLFPCFPVSGVCFTWECGLFLGFPVSGVCFIFQACQQSARGQEEPTKQQESKEEWVTFQTRTLHFVLFQDLAVTPSHMFHWATLSFFTSGLSNQNALFCPFSRPSTNTQSCVPLGHIVLFHKCPFRPEHTILSFFKT